jgi:hypothetical protein
MSNNFQDFDEANESGGINVLAPQMQQHQDDYDQVESVVVKRD